MDLIEKQQYLKRIDAALDDIRPHLAVDGGNIEIVDLTDDFLLKVRWLGNCQTCNMSAMTMRAGVAHSVKTKVPEVLNIEAVDNSQLTVNN